jgi:cytochrome b561
VSIDDRAERRWPSVIVAVHWGTGLLALTVAGLAIYLLSPPDWSQPYIDRYKAWIGWHKLGGLLVLDLALFWAAMRRRAARPPAIGGPPARLVHSALLVLILALPVSGYLMDAFVNARLELPFGIGIPSPFARHDGPSIALSYLHKWGGWFLVGLAAAHAIAATGHAMRPGDSVLRAMMPGFIKGKRR